MEKVLKRSLSVKVIDATPARSVRHTMPRAVVDRYAAMAGLPPIRVIHTADGRFLCYDGSMRLSAALARRDERIEVYVKRGSEAEAYALRNWRPGPGSRSPSSGPFERPTWNRDIWPRFPNRFT